jgi:hypothetical protein
VIAALFASITGLRRRRARGAAVAGLVLGLAYGILFALSDPVTAGAVLIPATAIGFAITQWR